MPSILVTYGTRPLAQRLAKFVGDRYSIVPATSEEVPSVLSERFRLIPNAKNPVYTHEILKVCLDLGVEYVLPIHTDEIHVLRETRVLFEEYGISLLIPASLNRPVVVNVPSTYALTLVHEGQALDGGVKRIEGLTVEDSGLFTLHEGLWHLVSI